MDEPPIPPSAPGLPSSWMPTPHVRPVAPPPPMPGRTPPLWRETLDAHEDDPDTGESPFAGLLILVAIGRVLAIPASLYYVIHWGQIFFRPGVWTQLTSPNSSAYHPVWGAAIVYEGAGKLGVFLCCVILSWMFFARKRIFRPAIIIYSLVLLMYLWGDHFLGGMIPAVRETAAHNHPAQLISVTVSTMIWVPYYFLSERMKRVFVR